MLRIKPNAGVSLAGIQPETVVGMMVVRDVFAKAGYDLIITRGTEFVEWQTADSKHPRGYAFDGRKLRLVPEDEREGLLAKCREALDEEWDCTESPYNFHFEFDPK